jgi:hypothetical protein
MNFSYRLDGETLLLNGDKRFLEFAGPDLPDLPAQQKVILDR